MYIYIYMYLYNIPKFENYLMLIHVTPTEVLKNVFMTSDPLSLFWGFTISNWPMFTLIINV